MSREEQQSPLSIFHVMLLLFIFGSGKGCLVGSLDGEMTN